MDDDIKSIDDICENKVRTTLTTNTLYDCDNCNGKKTYCAHYTGHKEILRINSLEPEYLRYRR